MHQHISILNLIPLRELTFRNRVTSSVLNNVTIGIGALIHASNAKARVVSLGSISLIISLSKSGLASEPEMPFP